MGVERGVVGELSEVSQDTNSAESVDERDHQARLIQRLVRSHESVYNELLYSWTLDEANEMELTRLQNKLPVLVYLLRMERDAEKARANLSEARLALLRAVLDSKTNE